MPSVTKLSVSLAREDAAWAQATAKRLGVSVSSVVADALRRQRQTEARARLLDVLGHDDITEADLDAMRRELRGAKKRARRNA